MLEVVIVAAWNRTVQIRTGMKGVTRAQLSAGRPAIGFEIKDSIYMDILTDIGFCHALHLVMCLDISQAWNK